MLIVLLAVLVHRMRRDQQRRHGYEIKPVTINLASPSSKILKSSSTTTTKSTADETRKDIRGSSDSQQERSTAQAYIEALEDHQVSRHVDSTPGQANTSSLPTAETDLSDRIRKFSWTAAEDGSTRQELLKDIRESLYSQTGTVKAEQVTVATPGPASDISQVEPAVATPGISPAHDNYAADLAQDPHSSELDGLVQENQAVSLPPSGLTGERNVEINRCPLGTLPDSGSTGQSRALSACKYQVVYEDFNLKDSMALSLPYGKKGVRSGKENRTEYSMVVPARHLEGRSTGPKGTSGKDIIIYEEAIADERV